MEISDVSQTMFNCIKYEICGQNEQIVLPEVSSQFLIELYKLSKAHDVAHLVGDALNKSGAFKCLPADMQESECAAVSKIKAKFTEQIFTAVYRYESINYELEQICKKLEKAKIQFIPLKGSVIRKYYPEPWMRTSCDIDILVRKEDLNKTKNTILKTLGYNESEDRTHHDISLYSPSGVHLELHYTLIEDDRFPNADKILNKCWEYADKEHACGSMGIFKDSFFYFYHILHMAKHVKGGGCGVRPFLDLWILNHRIKKNKSERIQLLSEGGIQKFANVAEIISNEWFSKKGKHVPEGFQNAQNEESVQELSDYILNGGVYGTLKNRVTVQRVNKSKFSYLISRIFLPYRDLSLLYPDLERHKWLLPFYEVKRWCSILFGGRVKNGINELSESGKVTREDQKKIQNLLKNLDIM